MGTRDMIRKTGFSNYTSSIGYMVVYPLGIRRRWNDGRNLNHSFADRKKVKDVQYLLDLKQHLQEKFPVDPELFYLVGFSNGGFMTARVQCETKNEFAGYAIVSAGISKKLFPKCKEPDKKPTLLIWGENDDVVPFHGGRISIHNRKRTRRILAGETLSFVDTMAHYKEKFSCLEEKSYYPSDSVEDFSRNKENTQTTDSKYIQNRNNYITEKNNSKNQNIRITEIINCKDQGMIKGYAVKNGTHNWFTKPFSNFPLEKNPEFRDGMLKDPDLRKDEDGFNDFDGTIAILEYFLDEERKGILKNLVENQLYFSIDLYNRIQIFLHEPKGDR